MSGGQTQINGSTQILVDSVSGATTAGVGQIALGSVHYANLASDVTSLIGATGVTSLTVVNNATTNASTGAVILTNSLTPAYTTVSATGEIWGAASGSGDAFQVGNDVHLVDINVANTMSVQGGSSRTIGRIQFGSSGPVIENSGTTLITANQFNIDSINIANTTQGIEGPGGGPLRFNVFTNQPVQIGGGVGSGSIQGLTVQGNINTNASGGQAGSGSFAGNLTVNAGKQVYYNGIGTATGVVGTDIRFDTITGGAGAGVGNIGSQAVDAYNIKDGAIIASKLSLPAIASVVASGAGNNTANSFFRFAYLNNSYLDPATGQQLSGLTPQSTSTLAADQQAYQGYAIKIPSTQASGTVGQSGPGVTVPNGIYTVTVFIRVAANSSSSPACTFTATTSSGTATVTGSPSVNANQLSTTGYMGYSFSITCTSAVGLNIQTKSGGLTDVYVSHVAANPATATITPALTSVFVPNIIATSALISSVSATSLIAGYINSDDIYLGTSGHIYAGNKTGGRVELNAAGVQMYQTVNLFTFDTTLESANIPFGTGWTTAGVNSSTAQAYQGTRSNVVTKSASGDGDALHLFSVAVPAIVNGTTYTCSAWVRTTATSYWKITDDGTLAGATQGTLNAVQPVAANTWTRIQAYFTPAADVTGVFVFRAYSDAAATLALATGTVAYIDAVQCEVGTVATVFTNNTSSSATALTLANNGLITATNPSGARIIIDPHYGLDFYDTSSVSKLHLDMTTGGATFGGALSAPTGNIGGWTIGASTLTGTNVTLDSTGTVRVGSSTNTVGMTQASGLWAGAASYTTAAPFNVSVAGSLTSTLGSIAGWTIGTTALTGTNVTLDKSGIVSVGSGTNYVIMQQGVGIWAGHSAFASAPFRVDITGNLTLAGTTTLGGTLGVTGTITAGSTAVSTSRVEIDTGGIRLISRDASSNDLVQVDLNTSTGLSTFTGAVKATSLSTVGPATSYSSTFGSGSYTAGTTPGDWTVKIGSTTDITYTVQTATSTSGQVLRFTQKATSAANSYLIASPNLVASMVDGEVLVDVKVGSLAASNPNVVLAAMRMGTAATPNSGTVLVYATMTGSPSVSWASYGAGSTTSSTSVTAPNTSTYTRYRIRLSGNLLQIKGWAATGTEPAAWQSTIALSGTGYGGAIAGAWGVGMVTTAANQNISADFQQVAITSTSGAFNADVNGNVWIGGASPATAPFAVSYSGANATITNNAGGTLTVPATTNHTGDVQYNGGSLPRGRIVTATPVVANSATFTTVAVDIITTTATYVTGRRYRISASGLGCFSTVAGDTYEIQLFIDGVQFHTYREVCRTGTAGNSWGFAVTIQCGNSNIAPSLFTNGSRVIKISCVRNAGTGTLTHGAGTAAPATLSVEDVGV